MIGERLAVARRLKGLKQSELAAAIGDRYNQSVISKAEAGLTDLLFEGATAAARTLDVSLDWLAGLSGTPTPPARLEREHKRLATELARAQAVDQQEETAGGRPPPDGNGLPFAREGITPVPLIENAAIAAGAASNADNERVLSYVPFRDDWMRSRNLNPKRCCVIEVVGDSMEPTLEDRGTILVDFDRTTRQTNRIFAVHTEDGPIVKRLKCDDAGTWSLTSDNPACPALDWPPNASLIGQVMWTGKTL
jgi:phage repressor protein C with HTH and peptisase S24 domain